MIILCQQSLFCTIQFHQQNYAQIYQKTHLELKRLMLYARGLKLAGRIEKIKKKNWIISQCFKKK